MADKAEVFIEGRVGQEPEIKISKAGDPYVRFSVAVTERSRQDGEWVDGNTSWYRVTAFKGLAETVGDTIRKGDLVNVRGRMKVDTWEGNDGTSRTDVAVAADSVGLVRSKGTRLQSVAPSDNPPF